MMNRDESHTHVEVDVDGRVVATADVEEHDERGVVRASLRVVPGHQPTGSQTRLVDAVLDLPEVHDQQRLEATLPIGDCEILERLGERSEDMQTRPAGATYLVDADLPEAGSPLQPPSAVDVDNGDAESPTT